MVPDEMNFFSQKGISGSFLAQADQIFSNCE